MHVVIIGNGITGTTAALRIRELHRDWRITMISKESDYFYSRPALMYVSMGHMRLEDTQPFEPSFWDHNRIERVRGFVSEIETARRIVRLDGGADIAYDQLLVATGSTPNKFGWPGQDLERVQGLYDLQDLESLERASPGLRQAVIVGGGLIGIELAEMLHSRGVHVVFLVREASFWDIAIPGGESAMINHTIREHGIELRLETELAEILDDGQGRACGVRTNRGDTVECQLVGLTAGVRPNLGAVSGSDIPTGRGILVDFSFRTSIPGVFAAGDCAELVTPGDERNHLEQLWYTGKKHGEVVGDVISGRERTYDRGIWFNSAKFLDLEWQTYGQVPPDSRRPPGQKHLWWQHPNGRLGMRLVVDDGAVVGMNSIGIRQRHQVWEDWIAKRRPVDYVLRRLKKSNFDPEFFKRFEPAIVGSFKEQI